jgi:pSer/pThr/pTyr-binding forkhead associated (FHA) protein
MAKLEVYLKNERIESRELTSETLSIGRKPDNDLVLHDLTVSRVHAQLDYAKDGKFWQLKNMSKTNPVKLNGEELTKPEIMFDDDHISIGMYTLVFRYGESPELPPLVDEIPSAKKTPLRSDHLYSGKSTDETILPPQ